MFIFFIFFILSPLAAQAASAGGGGVPWGLISSQVVNFGILIILGKIFLKKPLKAVVKKKRETFLLAEDNVSKSAKQANVLLQNWQDKWNGLSDSFTKKIQEAKLNSLQLSEQKLQDTKQQTIQILEKAHTQIQEELANAKIQLAELLLQTSCDVALENQKKQTPANNINLSLLKNGNGNRLVNEKN